MPKFNSERFRSKYDPAIMRLASVFHDAVRSGEAAPYFLTLTFDRYGDRYVVSYASEAAPTREEVRAGLTRQMPPAAALDRRQTDIRCFYIRLCRQLLGRDWAAMGDLQPRGIGWLDRPAFKTVSKRSPLARHPGDVFEHAHIALAVPTVARLGRKMSVMERFDALCRSGIPSEIWHRSNRGGEVHIDPMWDPYGALDYSAKTAKREDQFMEYMIVLPCR
jgi:hypothetical protein